MFTITNVSIYPVNSDSTLKAFATLEIDSAFVVKGIKIIEGKSGLFVAMPSHKGDDGEYYDDAFPVTKKAREDINEAILSVYESELADKKPTKKSYKKK
jgi:stage V sporulation protein G